MAADPKKLGQLLAEVEDVLRSVPPRETLRHETNENFSWLGRAAAVIQEWDLPRMISWNQAVARFHDRMGPTSTLGYREIMVLLNQAQHDLRMKTTGPLTIAIGQGRVFEYFNELRKIVEQATQEVFFVDAYLDADFVSRYLPPIRKGVGARLLMGTEPAKLNRLLPAVDLFIKETGQTINVRSAAGLHDRYVFIDRTNCYHSGASFKDGGTKAGTVISQITDAFKPMWDTYENLWSTAKVER